MSKMRTKKLPAVAHLEFYRATFGDVTLAAVLSADGPYISRIDDSPHEGVAIGPRVKLHTMHEMNGQWRKCKRITRKPWPARRP